MDVDTDVVAEIGRQRGDLHPGLGLEVLGGGLQPLLIAGDQDEVKAALGEAIGIDGADAG